MGRKGQDDDVDLKMMIWATSGSPRPPLDPLNLKESHVGVVPDWRIHVTMATRVQKENKYFYIKKTKRKKNTMMTTKMNPLL